MWGRMSEYAYHRMKSMLRKVPADHSMFGALTDGVLRMPLSSGDGRQRTWTKTVRKLADEIINNPSADDDCWFVPANKEDGFHFVKLSTDGSRNKWMTHRVTYVLLHPESYGLVNTRTVALQAAHRCGFGKAAERGGRACVNPFHVVLATSFVNNDHKGCKYGCARLCVHTPKCLFNWHDTGKSKPCFNNPTHLADEKDCVCERRCTHARGVAVARKEPRVVVSVDDDDDFQ